MSGPALWRLAAGWVPIKKFLGVVGLAYGLGTLLVAVRRGVATPAQPHGSDILIAGTLAFLASGVVSSCIASQWAAVRACPFAWNTPAMMRLFLRALQAGAIVTVPAAALLGYLLHGVVGFSIGFLPLMSAAGYAVGIMNTAETRWALRMGGLLALAIASVPVLLAPEIDGGIRGWSLAYAAGACLALAVFIRQCSVTRSLERARVDPGWGGSWVEYCMRQFKAPRGGAARGARTRHSTADWVQAVLHAVHGHRGGVWRMAVRVAIMVTLGLVYVRLIMLPLFASVLIPPGHEPVGQPSSGVDAPAWVARFIVPDSAGSELLTILLCGLGLAVMSCMVSSVPVLGVRLPVSRSRLARVLWMRTQFEECGYLLCALATLACLGLALAHYAGEAAWTIVGLWMKGLVVMFALLPLARVTRMLLIRSGDPFADPWRMNGSTALTVWGGIVVCMAALMLGTKLAIVGWDETMLHLRAELPLDLRPWTFLLAVPPILLLRWAWLRVLARHCRTCDLDVG